MESTTYLERLPNGIVFPASVRSRVHFDSDRQQLVFEGFMGLADFDALRSASTDPDYIMAVESLFLKSSRGSSTQVHPPWFNRAIVLALAVAGLMMALWFSR